MKRPPPFGRTQDRPEARAFFVVYTSSSSGLLMAENAGNLWLAKALWDLGAVQFGDYTIGRTTQHSPIYVNLRLLISNPRALARAARVMNEEVQTLQSMLHPHVQPFQRVCGIPFGGLHLATAFSLR